MKKAKKTENIIIRCTKDFKRDLQELANEKRITLSLLIISLCYPAISNKFKISNKVDQETIHIMKVVKAIKLMQSKNINERRMANELNDNKLFDTNGERWNALRVSAFMRIHARHF